MNFGSAWELSDIDLWNIDLLDTHLDLLDTDIPSKYFVSFHSAFKTSSRHVFNTSSRYVTMFRLPRLLQDVLQDVFNTSSRRFCKTSSRLLGRHTRWRHVEDVLKTNKCLLGLFFFTVSAFSYTGRIFRRRHHFSRWSHLA